MAVTLSVTVILEQMLSGLIELKFLSPGGPFEYFIPGKVGLFATAGLAAFPGNLSLKTF